MKKIIKNISLLSLIIMTLTVFADRVYASDTCGSRSVDVCENQKIDENGDPCKVEYDGTSRVCKINSDAKKCGDYGYTVCPEEDDYGNKCDSVQQTCTPVESYTYHAPKKCGDYEKSECMSGMLDDYGNVCARDSYGQCYVSNNKQACSTIKDDGICNGRTGECTWKAGSMGTGECLPVIEPTSYSTPCGDIIDLDECISRTDCDTKTSISGVFCTNKDGSSSKGGKKGGSGSIINKSDTPFKCSDVKYLTGAWTLIRIAAPFIVILFGSLDFIKAVMASDEKKMKETKGKFIKRLIAFVLLILLPFVVQFIFSRMGTFGSDNMCLVKCIVTNNTSEEECD